jgi:uncharacterized protein
LATRYYRLFDGRFGAVYARTTRLGQAKMGLWRGDWYATDGLARFSDAWNAVYFSFAAHNSKINKKMKKIHLFLLFSLAFTLNMAAQITTTTAETVKDKAYKIVFQLTSNDTLVQKALIKQVNNALTAAPKSSIEVVCHNNGITFLQISKSLSAEGIKTLKAKGVVFSACENTMADRKIAKTDILPEAVFVPSGIIEIADKQLSGWAYLKAGF